MLRSLASCLLLLLAAPALAEPAIPPDAGHGRAERAFEKFAADWMKKARALERHAREKPTVKTGATDPVFTYRGYGNDYSIELRPTGYVRAPYVGLLRYTEHVYSCESMQAEACNVASTMPITEIFRYKNGLWSY